jgi:hypothetical protein
VLQFDYRYLVYFCAELSFIVCIYTRYTKYGVLRNTKRLIPLPDRYLASLQGWLRTSHVHPLR